MSRGAACPDELPTEANQYQTRCTASGPTPIQPDGTSGRASSPDVQKSPAWEEGSTTPQVPPGP